MPAFVLRLSRLEQSASFGQFWGIRDCVTCYGFGGGLCYVLRLWAVSVLRVTAFGGSCVTQCYVLQLFGSVTLDGVECIGISDLHGVGLQSSPRLFSIVDPLGGCGCMLSIVDLSSEVVCSASRR